ncbi:hypothetical protein [Streptomyces sp. Cmuel-A718b]|uniref:hypothetical protein n=1 Tax=Streptomyces sp. Cmuel-A718b TaxID=697328 RepID=UPI00081F6B68|nr:hypothetical protein [Streptomyces sp. Cmuel-A718b]SCF72858.1 hypothetical protein GA0115280_10943 [Streptomyces sp. Cmuel-A718b]
MTATAAARAAVDPRPARGTAGRRAVQVVLFLGGLLALGLLAGGRAEAQERPDPGGLTASVADAVPGADQVVGPVAEPVVEPVADRVVEPVAASVVEPVDRAVRHQAAQHRAAQPGPVRNATAAPATKPVTEPVGSVASADPGASADPVASTPVRVRDARDAVVGGAGEAVDRIAGEARPLVASLPGLPPLLSALPVPGDAPDSPGAPGAPSPSAPDTGRGAEGPTTPGDTDADAPAERAAGGHDRSIGAPGFTSAGPDRSGTPGAGHAQLTAPTPTFPPTQDRAPFAPCGDLARTAVADAQGPRGGDLHAAPVPGGPYAALVRGAGLPATAAPITDRSGEILEFPG